MSKTIPGTVVVTDKATLAAGYGLVPGEQPYVRVYDISEAKSPAAMTSINAAAGAVGGTVVATVNVELGKLAGGKFSLLEQGGAPITMAFGIPKNAVKPGYAYAMICVRPGGVIEVLPDLDADPNTVTFSTNHDVMRVSVRVGDGRENELEEVESVDGEKEKKKLESEDVHVWRDQGSITQIKGHDSPGSSSCSW